MKRLILILSITCSLSHAEDNYESLQGVSFFSPRSQSENSARELVGWHPYIHRYDADDIYATFAATPVFSHSIRRERIADAMFGNSILFISGSQIVRRGNQDLLADYFGLSPAFESVVELDPYIQNAMGDFQLFIGFDNIAHGLFFSLHAPVVLTRWYLRLRESIFTTGESTPFPAGYMDIGEVSPAALSFTQAIRDGVVFGQMQEPLAFGRMGISQSKTGFSDLQMAFGYDIVSKETGHAGLAALVRAPTGSHAESDILFAPLIGNGKHWEFGLGFTGKVRIWEKDGEQQLFFLGDFNLTHIFKARQRRSFDLCLNGFGSRYLLVKEFTAEGNYTGKLSPLINHTSLACNVWNDYQFDISVAFGYLYNGFTLDIGYNGWIRANEKISLHDKKQFATQFGIKGTTDVSTDGLANNTTQPLARITDNFNAPDRGPTFVSICDINLKSAASPRLLTHKIFAHISYGCPSNSFCDTIAFAGIGGEIEFEGINLRNTVHFARTTLAQWSLWIKAGIAFG
jgi:hypothetical protein